MRLLRSDLIRLEATAWLKLIYTPKPLVGFVEEKRYFITPEQAAKFISSYVFHVQNDKTPSRSGVDTNSGPSETVTKAAKEAGIDQFLPRNTSIKVNPITSTISQQVGHHKPYIEILNEETLFPDLYYLNIQQAMREVEYAFGNTSLILDKEEQDLIMTQLQEKLESINNENVLLEDYAMLAAPGENAYFPFELVDIAKKDALKSLIKSATKAIDAQIDQLEKEIRNPSFVLSFFHSAAKADIALKTNKMEFLKLFYNRMNCGMSAAEAFKEARLEWQNDGKDYAEVIQGTFSQRTLNLLKQYVGDEASKLEDINLSIENKASIIS